MERCIIRGEDPEPLNASDILALYPKSTAGKSVTVGNDAKQLIASLGDMKAAEKELKAEIDTISDQVKVLFTDAEQLVDIDGNVLATYKSTAGRSSVDTAKLKEQYPEVYEACLKQSAGSRMLKIK